MMFLRNLAWCSLAVTATFPWMGLAADTTPTSTVSPLPSGIPSGFSPCAQHCIEETVQGEVSDCDDASAATRVQCLCTSVLFSKFTGDCILNTCHEDSDPPVLAWKQANCNNPAPSGSTSVAPSAGISSTTIASQPSTSGSTSSTDHPESASDSQSSNHGQSGVSSISEIESDSLGGSPSSNTAVSASITTGAAVVSSMTGSIVQASQSSDPTISESKESTTATASGTGAAGNINPTSRSFPAQSAVPPDPSSLTGGALPTKTHTRNSIKLLIALPLSLSIISIVALAFLYKRVRRHRAKSAGAMPHPHPKLPLPSHSSENCNNPPLKGGQGSFLFEHPVHENQEMPAPESHADPDPQQRVSSPPVSSPPDHPQADIQAPHDDPTHVNPQGRRETSVEERMMLIPWSLGERLLAGLWSRHEGSGNGSTVGSETLPPYEERDART